MPAFLKPPPAFSERYASWTRIEPRCRDDDFSRGIQARTADALWFLTRQWQTGEFQAEDAGSPFEVSTTCEVQKIESVALADEEPISIDEKVGGELSPRPTELLVERERPSLSYRDRVRIGRSFERGLLGALEGKGEASSIDTVLAAFRELPDVGFPRSPETPVSKLDAATRRFVHLMRGRVVDGAAIVAGPLPDAAGVLTEAEVEAVRSVAKARYVGTVGHAQSSRPKAWEPRELDYNFGVSTEPDTGGKTTTLVADSYRNGDLDWYSVDAGGTETQRSAEMTPLPRLTTTPTRIEVTDTSLRWWELEDGQTNFGDLDVATPDLAKMLLMEFALVYGDDWFSVPMPIEMGNLVRVKSLQVRNVFGETTSVGPARDVDGGPESRFDMYTLAPHADQRAPGIAVESRPLLYVPRIAGARLESPPIDEVHFQRDEGANMVWGIEHIVPNGLGRPVRGADAHRERLSMADEQERAGLEAFLADVAAQLRTLAEELEELPAGPQRDERELTKATFQQQQRLVSARLEELNPDAPRTPRQGEAPSFRLMSQLPSNWVPFVPAQVGEVDGKALWDLRRSKLLRNTEHARLGGVELSETVLQEAAQRMGVPLSALSWMRDGGGPADVEALSKLLALDEHALLWLAEHAVPRSGVRVQLTKQRVRGVDGRTHLWVGRKVLVGRGEAASGLRFDYVEGDPR